MCDSKIKQDSFKLLAHRHQTKIHRPSETVFMAFLKYTPVAMVLPGNGGGGGGPPHPGGGGGAGGGGGGGSALSGSNNEVLMSSLFGLFCRRLKKIRKLINGLRSVWDQVRCACLSQERVQLVIISEPSSEIWETRFILIWIELSSQLGLVASLMQFQCTKYFCDDLTLVYEDAQSFNSISKPSPEIWKTRFILSNLCYGERFKCVYKPEISHIFTISGPHGPIHF